MTQMTLPTDGAARKEYPLYSGPGRYFPAALAGVARICKKGNDKHNPGQPLHWARSKSADHPDCVWRHSMDVGDLEAWLERNPESEFRDQVQAAILEEVDQLAWRALAWSQLLHERYGGAPLAPGARE